MALSHPTHQRVTPTVGRSQNNFESDLSMNIRPSETFVPILGYDEKSNTKVFLGTGTFVGDKPWLVTAEHVVRDWRGVLGVINVEKSARIHEAKLLASDPQVDLALLEVPGYSLSKTVQLAEDDEIRYNLPVVCYEYGTTRTQGTFINFAPATRLGNVTRQLDLSDRFNKAGENILELSFPALRGASGAPVLSNHDYKLWGIVIANVSYYLLPAQIESVLDEKNNLIAETYYLLPQAVAVHVKHVRAFIQQYVVKVNGDKTGE